MGGVVAAVAVGIIAAISALSVIVTLIASNWKTITQDAQAFWNGLINIVSNAILAIENLVTGFVTKIQNMFNAVTSMVRSIASAAGSVGSAIGGAASTAVHAFASGGIVTSPTLALVGEAGPEAIIPLSAFAGGSSLAGVGNGGGGSGNIVVNINGGNYLDSNGATMIANAIGKQVQRQLRVSNFN
jgi:phage-related minor tail protein